MLKSDCFSLHSANYMAVYIIYFWALCLELVWIEKACCHTDWYGWKSVPRSRDIRPECINLSVSKKVCTSELNMLEHYDSRLDQKTFSEIDIKYVNGYDVFLQKRGCIGNTRKYYFKAQSSILTIAIQEKEATEKTYPFGKGGFQIAKLDEETEKRYLPVEYLNKIKNTVSEKPQREYARKLFLLSYYCYGISFVDMAYLTKSNIVKFNGGEYIVYKRHKIQHQKGVKPIKIKKTKEIISTAAWNSCNFDRQSFCCTAG